MNLKNTLPNSKFIPPEIVNTHAHRRSTTINEVKPPVKRKRPRINRSHQLGLLA